MAAMRSELHLEGSEMSPLPTICTHCRRPFADQDARRRLTILEHRMALCGECAWVAEHPEAGSGDGSRQQVDGSQGA